MWMCGIRFQISFISGEGSEGSETFKNVCMLEGLSYLNCIHAEVWSGFGL